MRSIAHKIRTGLSLREALEAAGVSPPHIPDLGEEEGDEFLLDEEADAEE